LGSCCFGGAAAIGVAGHGGPPSNGIDGAAVNFDPFDQCLLVVFSEYPTPAGAAVANQRETDAAIFDKVCKPVDGEDRVATGKAA
jgi:hypothetical protein